MESFAKALALGCDEVETDVWLTEDGRLLISHDPPGAGATLTLEEVLDFCRGRLAVNAEVKCVGSERKAHETGANVARVASRHPDAYVSSFWWSALEGSRAAAPSVRRAFLFADSPDRPSLLESGRSLRLWALHPNRVYVTPDLVKDAHSAGLKVNVWTVNEPREIEILAGWGVDGIMSDYPERVPKG